MIWIERKLTVCQNCNTQVRNVIKISTGENMKTSQMVCLCNNCLRHLRDLLEVRLYQDTKTELNQTR